MATILTSPLISFLIVLIGILGLFLGFIFIIWQDKDVSKRIENFVENPDQTPSNKQGESNSTTGRFRKRFNVLFGGIKSEEMHKSLIAANWPVSVNEYVFIRIIVVLVTFLIGAIIGRSLLSGFGLAILGYMVPGFLLFQSIQKRQKLFQDQLIDSLNLIRGAVEVGNSFQQSLNVVIQEMDAPTSEEFRQVRRETELGLPLNRALLNMAKRMESGDFKLVVTAVNINIQTGGNLSSILKVVIDTIRERIALFSEIRALTSYANFASYLLSLLPVATVAILSVISPVYWERLLLPGITRYIMIYAIISIIVGNIVLRRIARIDV